MVDIEDCRRASGIYPGRDVPLARRASHLVGMMTIDQFMHTIEYARAQALPGREAATRDALLCELRRLLEREPRQIKCCQAETFEVRLVRN
jgi:hypothetical protein